jgi:hypothetical protein
MLHFVGIRSFASWPFTKNIRASKSLSQKLPQIAKSEKAAS